MQKIDALAGLTVIVTRPEKQAQSLCQQLQQVGANVVALPMLDIIPHSLSEQGLDKLTVADIAIFTSINAVEYTILQQVVIPASVQIACVGASTAQALAEHGYTADSVPQENYSSEGLLALPSLSKVENKTILIFSGVGGRTLLEDTLRERGAVVYKVATYERHKVVMSSKDLL